MTQSESTGAPAGTRPHVSSRPRIIVLGGGYVGLYTTMRLLHRLRKREADVTVIDPRSYMTYQPFLPEASAGSLDARHVVVPLRKVLKGAEILNARVVSVDHTRQVVRVAPLEGPEYDVPYDIVVVALGSVARTLPIPGLSDEAVGFKTVEEAIYLRNQVLECLDIAESTADEARRRRALTFVFIGGGYAGVEAMAELEDMARFATRYYSRVTPQDLRFVMVEATDHILPEVGADMGRWTVEQLRKRGIEMALSTRLDSCVGGHGRALGRPEVRVGHDRVDGRGEGQPGAHRHRPAGRREGPAQGLGHPAGRRASRTPGVRATRWPCPT